LLLNRPAIAQVIEAAVTEDAVTEVSNSGHGCNETTTIEQPSPIGELKQALLETAVTLSKKNSSTSDQVVFLLDLGQYYACLGHSTKALALTEDALELANSVEESSTQMNLLSQVVHQYGRWENYEKIREIVDNTESEQIANSLIRSSVYWLHNLASEENRAQLNALFPELTDIFTDTFSEEDSLTSVIIKDPTNVPEISEVEAWSYEVNEVFYALSNDEPTEAIAAFISEQIATIETFPDLYSQSYGYVTLGMYMVELGDREQATLLIETAVQKFNAFDGESKPDVLNAIFGDYPFELLLSSALIQIEDYENAIALVRGIEDSDMDAVQIFSFLTTAETLIDVEQFDLAAEIVESAEEIARTSDVADIEGTLGEIAILYLESGRVEQSQKIIQEMLATANRQPTFDTYTLFPEVVGTLIYAGRADIAEEIVQEITSPILKIAVLTEMAANYYYDINDDFDSDRSANQKAFTLLTRALAIAEGEDVASDAAHSIFAKYGLTAVETALAEMTEPELRYTLISNIVEAAIANEQQQDLIALIQDETLRERVTQEQYLAFAIAQPYEPTADDRRRTEAIDAAKEKDFPQAMLIISQMEESAAQIQTLMTIAKCYVSSEATLDEATNLVLERMQQQQ